MSNEVKLNTAHRAAAVASGLLSVMIARRKINRLKLKEMAVALRNAADLLESVG